jgi:SSS family solute:Na+ symporter
MIDNIIVIAYLLITLILGLTVSTFVKSEKDFVTGGSNYSAWIIFATLSGSFLGGGFTIGLAEKTYLYGLIFVVAIWGFSLKEILIAKFIAPRIHRFQGKALTVGDIIEEGYGRSAKIISGFASLVCCGGIIGAQVAACGNILYTLTGMSPITGSIIAAGIVVIYATAGGMKSVVTVDVLHFTVIVIMIPLVLFFGLKQIGSIDEFLRLVPNSHLKIFGNLGSVSLAILFISFFLGETLIPPYVQRLLIGKNSYETEKGTLLSGLLSIVFFLIIGLIGIVALAIDNSIEPKFALPFVITNTMPVGIKGLAIAAMVAVIMSSADSFLNATSVAVKNDLLKPLGLTNSKYISEVNISRLVTFIIGAVAIAFALTTSSVIDILLYSYQFWTPFMLIPLVSVILGIKSSKTAFLGAALCGISSVVIWNIFEPFSIGIDGALEGVIVGVIMNTIAFILLTKYTSTNENLSNVGL